MMGLAHAGLGVADANGNLICPDEATVTGGEDWQPDNYGRLQGWEGFVSPFSALRLHGPALFLERQDMSANPLYDLMSYCASTDDLHNLNAWLSPHNWQRELRALQSFGHRLAGETTFSRRRSPDLGARAHAAAALLLVTGIVNSHGGYIADVAPTTSAVAASPGSQVSVRAFNASGAQLASSAASLEAGDVHPGELPSAGFAATVPARAARIDLVSGGTVLDSRGRPIHAPTVAFAGPSGGSLVGRSGSVLVRWAARDASHQQLLATIDYSRNAGRVWQTIAAGVPGTSVTLPASLLAASRDARLRISVSDGFNDTVALSRIFRSAGAPPQAYITAPIASERLASSATVTLQGGAVADSGSQLTGGALSWYDGGRLLGHGASVSVRGLAPGAHALELRARDASARIGRATVRVLVSAVAPQVLSLNTSARVSRHARTVRIGLTVSLRAC